MSYIDSVAAHLTLRGAAREQALADLQDLLRELDPEELGCPAEYASALNEQFGASPGLPERLLGVPLSLISGLGDRFAGTFDPADERLLVPRLFGMGWTLNMGRLAVLLGLLRPDDVDDEILDDATDHLELPQAAAGLAIGAAAGTTALMAYRRREIEARSGESLTGGIVAGTLIPVVAAALLTASTDRSRPSAQRLTMPAVSAGLATITASASLQQLRRPGGSAYAFAGAAAAAAVQLSLSFLPVRAALRGRWSAQRSDRNA